MSYLKGGGKETVSESRNVTVSVKLAVGHVVYNRVEFSYVAA